SGFHSAQSLPGLSSHPIRVGTLIFSSFPLAPASAVGSQRFASQLVCGDDKYARPPFVRHVNNLLVPAHLSLPNRDPCIPRSVHPFTRTPQDLFNLVLLHAMIVNVRQLGIGVNVKTEVHSRASSCECFPVSGNLHSRVTNSSRFIIARATPTHAAVSARSTAAGFIFPTSFAAASGSALHATSRSSYSRVSSSSSPADGARARQSRKPWRMRSAGGPIFSSTIRLPSAW